MSFEENPDFKNPILEPENYFKDYQDSIDQHKNDPRVIEFDKLVYEVFHKSEPGKRLLEMAIERYVVPAMAARGTPTYQIDVLWAEGFKDVFRIFSNAIKSHEQRIQAGK